MRNRIFCSCWTTPYHEFFFGANWNDPTPLPSRNGTFKNTTLNTWRGLSCLSRILAHLRLDQLNWGEISQPRAQLRAHDSDSLRTHPANSRVKDLLGDFLCRISSNGPIELNKEEWEVRLCLQWLDNRISTDDLFFSLKLHMPLCLFECSAYGVVEIRGRCLRSVHWRCGGCLSLASPVPFTWTPNLLAVQPS